jgi:PAS domain S-box-containing protein
MNHKPIPTNKEHAVSADAFLVSKTDTHGKITYCNEPFLKIVGGSEQEVLGKPHSIIQSSTDASCYFQTFVG